MNRSRQILAACAAILSLTALPSLAARADTVTTGNTYSGSFNMLVAWTPGTFSVDGGVGGGNVGGSGGVIGGVAYDFQEFFCADLFTDATLTTTYAALYNQSGLIGGYAVDSAQQIAWLVLNIAPTLTTQDEYQGLQGLIWTLESPDRVKWDYADNTAAATADYTAYSAQLGSHTAPASDVWWVNPTDSNGHYAYQGFVAATAAQVQSSKLQLGQPLGGVAQIESVPEPASLGLLGSGVAALALRRARRGRKA